MSLFSDYVAKLEAETLTISEADDTRLAVHQREILLLGVVPNGPEAGVSTLFNDLVGKLDAETLTVADIENSGLPIYQRYVLLRLLLLG